MRARRRGWQRQIRNDEGSVLLLSVFSGLLSLIVVLGVTVATSLYIERKRLFTVADGAAAAAAEAFTLDDVTRADGKLIVHLTDAQVAAEAEAFLAIVSQSGSLPISLLSGTANDGRSATVVVQGEWRPPVVSMFFPQGMRLTVTATARTIFG
jgi:uncharacterized membrane protein